MSFTFNDGGRATAGYKGTTRDCVCRAISIATEMPYQQIYDALNEAAQSEHLSKHHKKKSSARTGVRSPTIRKFLAKLGWTWHPTMFIGKGCKVHLRADELPSGRIIVSVSRHLVAVLDGVIHDNHDSARDGTRCVYGYFVKNENS